MKKKDLQVDQEFVKLIAPIGGISYQPDFVRKGDGYECSIYVHEYPQNVNALWLNAFKIEDVVTSIILEPVKTEKVEEHLTRSIDEQLTRMYDEADSIARIKARRQYHELDELAAKLDSTGEVIHNVAVRLYLFKPTKLELEKKVQEVLQHLKKYSVTGTILLNEQENEFRSLFRSGQKEKFYKRKGVAMPALTVAAGYPFSFSKLSDPRGLHLGYSEDNGGIVFDLFHQTDKRPYYNACVFGTMGSGKSTLLKKLMKNFVLTNHRVRVLDPVGETVELIQLFGGKVISLDGTGEVLNPLERSENLETSISKAETFLRYLAPALNDHEIAQFGTVLRRIYERQETSPVFSDVLSELENMFADVSISPHRKAQLENLQIQLERIVFNYGKLFNRQTTIKTREEDSVVFTLRSLTSLDATVYQGQMFNILSHLWQELVVLGSEQKQLFEEGRISIEEVRGFAVIVDEAHNVLNSANANGVDYLVRFAREARKYFGGLIFASQSIRDAVSSTQSEVFEKIKTLFELTQYKFLLKQDPNAIQHIRQIFNEQMTDHQISAIPYLEKGQVILNITGDSNYKFKVFVSDEELALFKGGR
jgi:type IV secretory pathway VirB4 component